MEKSKRLVEDKALYNRVLKAAKLIEESCPHIQFYLSERFIVDAELVALASDQDAIQYWWDNESPPPEPYRPVPKPAPGPFNPNLNRNAWKLVDHFEANREGTNNPLSFTYRQMADACSIPSRSVALAMEELRNKGWIDFESPYGAGKPKIITTLYLSQFPEGVPKAEDNSSGDA